MSSRARDFAADIDTSLNSAVTALMVRVSNDILLPNFMNLQPDDVETKSKDEIVTYVDHTAEAALTAGLLHIDPSARVVGEEAAERDPGLLKMIGRGLVWIVDPLDGTANYVAGQGPFGMMIALAIDGVVEKGWIYDPQNRRLCFAARGEGARVNGVRMTVPWERRPRLIAALATQFMAPDTRQAFEAKGRSKFDLVPIPRCAAEHYPRVASGENDVAVFQRTLPWDHAPGVLFLEEAGGCAARWDGSPYRLDDGKGLVVASSRYALDAALNTLFNAD